MGQLKNSSKNLPWKTLSLYDQICRQITGNWAGLTSSESRNTNPITLQSTKYSAYLWVDHARGLAQPRMFELH